MLANPLILPDRTGCGQAVRTGTQLCRTRALECRRAPSGRGPSALCRRALGDRGAGEHDGTRPSAGPGALPDGGARRRSQLGFAALDSAERQLRLPQGNGQLPAYSAARRLKPGRSLATRAIRDLLDRGCISSQPSPEMSSLYESYANCLRRTVLNLGHRLPLTRPPECPCQTHTDAVARDNGLPKMGAARPLEPFPSGRPSVEFRL